MPFPFEIECLDHVAITVTDMETSIAWYEDVLGLKRVQPPEWKPAPAMMWAGNTGIAVFQAKKEGPGHGEPDAVRIDHFAFRVTGTAFDRARRSFEERGIVHEFADHKHFHSVYLKDPDGHTVELTTPKEGLSS